MSGPRPPSRPFTIVWDDLIRSPLIDSEALRAYMIMLSYCPKGGTDKVCNISRPALAGLMKMSIRGTTKVLQRLIALKLIDVNTEDPRRPVFTIITPPETICPPSLKGRQWGQVLDYVSDKGGLQENQTRKLNVKRRIVRRTGSPTPKNGIDNSDVDRAPRTRVHGAAEMTLNSGSGSEAVRPRTGVHGTPNWGSGSPRTGVHGDPELGFTPMYIKRDEERELSKDSHESSALVPFPYAAPQARSAKTNPPYSAPTPLTADAGLSTCIASGVDHGLAEGVAEKAAMAYSPEELKKERARKRKVKVDGPPRPNTGSADSDDATGDAEPMKERPSKGPKKPAKASGTAAVVQELTADPDSVCEAPDSPFHLYAHFCKAVRKKWPDAQFPAHDAKLLKWAKDLLKHYTRSQLYEMIRLVVLDFENINRVRTFFKYRGTPVPTWLFFYGNADTLVSFIGVGVIEPPGIRTSPYADDYARRKNPAATTTEPNGAAPQTSFEAELEAVRASVRARVHGEAPG